jgi:hypothetical protein
VAIHSQGSENAEPNKYQNSQFFAENPMVLMLFKWDVRGIFQYIPRNSHPDPQPLLMSIYHWHCQVAGTSASVAPQRHKARCAEKRRREKRHGRGVVERQRRAKTENMVQGSDA